MARVLMTRALAALCVGALLTMTSVNAQTTPTATAPATSDATMSATMSATTSATLSATADATNTVGANDVVLNSWAVLPADTFADGPQSGAQIDPTADINGKTIPFASQPVQGFSAILPAENGNWLVLTDNGFGAKSNSGDILLRFHEVSIDWASKTVTHVKFTGLSDPDRKITFPIVNNDTTDRLLTGADFDLESFRRAPDGTLWFGDEIGPFLLHTDANGRLLDAPIPTPIPPVLAPYAKGLGFVQSPDHPDFVGLADQPARQAAANHRSSRGFEGMAINAAGDKLYAMLEGTLTIDPLQSRLPLYEFDLTTKSYTSNVLYYAMSNPAHAIGEVTAINENEYLVIERDNNQGNATVFKRIYRIDLSKAAPDGVLAKTLVADLMLIKNPDALTTPEANTIGLGFDFTFPFQTIESVYPIDATTLIIVNDNNYPFSSGRRPGPEGKAADDNEFILITLPMALNLTVK